MWDDHEVLDNWYWERRQGRRRRASRRSRWRCSRRGRGRRSSSTTRCRSSATIPSGSTARFRMGPLVEVFALDMRTYKGANSENRQPAIDASSAVVGAAQLQWLKASLRGEHGDVEDRRRRSAARARRRRRPGPLRSRSPTASRARRSAASSRSPTCCGTCSAIASATSCGSPRTCTTAPRTTTIRRARSSPSFDPFWEFVAGPAQRRHVRARTRSTRLSDPK